MVSLKFFLLAAATAVGAAPVGAADPASDCGKLNVLLTGLPPFHPLVAAQGFNTTVVNNALRADHAAIVAAGYNPRVSFLGPESDLAILKNDMEGYEWATLGVGFGIRGSTLQNLTAMLEDIVALFEERSPESEIIFNRSPNTTLEALRRHFPLRTDCAGSPGTDLGFHVYCDIC